jgi:hypothetical protein
MPGSRAELYQTIDKPALQPLPAAPFVFAEWKKARVNLFCGPFRYVALIVAMPIFMGICSLKRHITRL